MLSLRSYDVQRYEADCYGHDHLDYDYVDYHRFGRVEELLASRKSFQPTARSEPGGGFFILATSRDAPAEPSDPGPAGVTQQKERQS